ncbi:Glycosyl hydrolase, family 3-like protein [Alteracholeplasma palmae J233]|uniref:Glycosyl hydrolase, family 3-like protein n=1 Tax=Alteracholeplasma palmae (strain ATCC 49389 / J233) TaxID=1318466 RepID=U4KL76_ALTPJ|nr:glycoside hydrolase family 3 protein [Alteracholeplasma palmae]CCV64508.1 Glycosyl hydrolase, family 3-like protein [Alteracholeplasma palmae J233]
MSQPLEVLRQFTRKVSTEGIVLLKNDQNILPLKISNVALFGRMQLHHYYSGTGSGGRVNLTDIENMIEVFSQYPKIDLNKKFIDLYTDWEIKNPFNHGDGSWKSEPWSQKEYLISKNLIIENKREEEIAIFILGRTAGEDKDNQNKSGSYKLTKIEEQMLLRIKEIYDKIIIILNTGNIIDMTFFEENDFSTILYFWHAGQDGMYGLADIITGLITPSGKLPITIPKSIKDYPKNEYDSSNKKIFYNEDIYVGYRYFETFEKDRVLYPFGYGLSYTEFSYESSDFIINNTQISFTAKIKNIGKCFGKEVLQVYLNHENSLIGKPLVELIAFSKTKYLKPQESQIINYNIDLKDFATFDDIGLLSENSFVIEKGKYNLYIGTCARTMKLVKTFIIKKNIIIEKHSYSIPSKIQFKRISNKNNSIIYEDTPDKRLEQEQVNLEKIHPNVSKLSKKDLSNIILGEGMYSKKVTPGTASAFGGITESLKEKGLKLFCCADGPSGIRMDNGSYATRIPIGTLLASTFNLSLIQELYQLVGHEMNNYQIDLLLAPGMNIQKNPLNGRNFEYFSEDPFLTGMMASATLKGLNKAGVTGVLKHFALNNQETLRTKIDVYVSERALREIYLKGFYYAIKNGAYAVMASYNKINNYYAASNKDLMTTILRDEWKFKGIVMTDWWSYLNDNNKTDTISMIDAGTDLYMVVEDAQTHKHNVIKNLNDETIISKLKLAATHIFNFNDDYKELRVKEIDFKKYQSNYLINEFDETKYEIKQEKENIIQAVNYQEERVDTYKIKQNKVEKLLEYTEEIDFLEEKIELKIEKPYNYKIISKKYLETTLSIQIKKITQFIEQNTILILLNKKVILTTLIQSQEDLYQTQVNLINGINALEIILPDRIKIESIKLEKNQI